MGIKVDKILGLVREQDESFTYEGARNKNTTDSYVESNGVFMNVSPVIIPKDMYLHTIAASTEGNETWTAEIHNNGVLISGATLSMSAVDSNSRKDLKIKVLAGSKLMFYVNGTNIKRPRILITLKK
jgi:hypothetical protein